MALFGILRAGMMVVIVKKDPGLTSEAVIEHCRENLTGYKVPRLIEFRGALPKSPSGKILRRELRDAPQAPEVPSTPAPS